MSDAKKTIILIEDDPSVGILCERILSGTYNVLRYVRSEDAIPKLQECDLIISDWEQLDSKGGRGLLEYIAAEKIETPVIIMSGLDLNEQEYQGAKAFIQKPIQSYETLEEAIKKYCPP